MPDPAQPQTPQTNAKRRTVFIKDARLTVKRFDAAKAAPADGDAPAADTEQPAHIATLEGYALLWNTLSDDRGGYKVRLLPKSATFIEPTMALFHHNFAKVIGNTQNGTLRIIPDDIGVKVEIDLPDTTTGRDAAELVDKKYVQGMSFAMCYDPTFEMVEENDQRIMNVSAFTCDEVTVTAIPSFTDTSIDVAEDNRPEPPANSSDDDDDEGGGEDDDAAMAAAKKNSSEASNRNLQFLKCQQYKLSQLTL